MIRLTRLTGKAFYLNADLIEHIDATPDTLVTLTSGPKFLVMESPEEVCEKVVAYRRSYLPSYLHDRESSQLASLDVAHG
jgi:flagellar protein FlbD